MSSPGFSWTCCRFRGSKIRHTAAVLGQHLLADAADRQRLAGEDDLARHREAADGCPVNADTIAAAIVTPAEARLGRVARLDVQKHVGAPGEGLVDAVASALARSHDSATCADSCMTSPSRPGRTRSPEPGIRLASTTSPSPVRCLDNLHFRAYCRSSRYKGWGSRLISFRGRSIF